TERLPSRQMWSARRATATRSRARFSARWLRRSPATVHPAASRLPAVGWSRPAIASRSGEPPVPEAPVITTRSPGWATRSTARNAQPREPRRPSPSSHTAGVVLGGSTGVSADGVSAEGAEPAEGAESAEGAEAGEADVPAEPTGSAETLPSVAVAADR